MSSRAPPGGTERATSVNTPLLQLQSSEGKFKMSREIEPVRRSFCRHGSCTFTEVARLVPSGSCSEASTAAAAATERPLWEPTTETTVSCMAVARAIQETFQGKV